ncbi:hypothetical protein AGOR_G00246900 [Albula goreensis]|uniref:Fibronectin type-III domain-containing protein n=1 Tax=Albula goreensis TaxID=1534307 RepID=A0A8T3CDY6_9TELE|nr:hypothetical protein AGOR_G00246900 [Albula goreensis]
MLRCKAVYIILCVATMFLQSETTEAVKCSINLTEPSVNKNSIQLKLTTSGEKCNFKVVVAENSSEKTCTEDEKDSKKFQCDITDLKPGTLYHLGIISKTDGEETNVPLQTDPQEPAHLDAMPDSSGTTGLKVSWPASPGRVGWYNLTLLDPLTGQTQSTNVTGTSRQYSFTALTPGTLYTLSLVAITGHKTSPPVQTSAATAPSAIRELRVTPLSDSLAVSWQPGLGRVERYRLLLRDPDTLIKNLTLENSVTTRNLTGLIPGHPYNITVVTEAAGRQNSLSTQRQTAPAPVSGLKLLNNGSRDTLRATWSLATGDVDSYLVILYASGSVHQQSTLPSLTTQTLFSNLTPGREYQVSVRTKSGTELSTETRATGQAVPETVIQLSMVGLSDESGLKMTWAPPRGDWNNYRVLLFNNSVALVNKTMGKGVREYTFSGMTLIPGRLYKAAVIAESGPLSSTTHCQGRIAPRPVQQLHIRHADETSLSAMWSHAWSEWDNQTVLLKHGGVTVGERLLSRDMRECTFNVLVPGRQYSIHVSTNSGGLSSSASVTGRTVPAEVKKLRVNNQGRTDSLQTSWERATGDTDSYRLLLIHDSIVIKNDSVPNITTAYHFPSLKPGALYRVVVTTVSGGLASRQTVVEGRTVPAAVREVTVSNNGRRDFLSVSWRPAQGDVDGYQVTLRDQEQEKIVHTQTIAKTSTEWVFNSLVSGRLYNISITSRSGNYENHTVVQERTQPSSVQNPSAVHSARDNYLKVYWPRAAGDFDYYQVFIKHNNIFYQNKTVNKTQTECVFNSLVPGRLYTVIVSTWSGKYESSATTDGRTFPAPVSGLALADRGTEDLKVTWTAAAGDVDHYEVQVLFSDMKVFPPVTLSNMAGECTLSNLTPGRLYKIVVSTFSGPNQRAQFIEGRTVPSKVKNIHVSNNGQSTSLKINWTPGQGDVDSYSVTLSLGTRILDTRPMPKHVNELGFQNLQPGQQYSVTVQSISGGLVNNNTASGRTVPSTVTSLQVDNQHTTSSLLATWMPATGISDGYSVQLLDERGVQVANGSQPAEPPSTASTT